MAERAKAMTYAERREPVAALGLVIVVRPVGSAPRYPLKLGIPLPAGTEYRIGF